MEEAEGPEEIPNESESVALIPKKKKSKPEPVPFQIVTRGAKARLELAKKFAFHLLPAELKELVLKRLALTDLKSARFVSREWKTICFRFVGIKMADLGDTTIPVLKNCGNFVQELCLTCLRDGRSLRGFPGQNVKTLNLKYPNIKTSTLGSVFKACPNIEEIGILYFRLKAQERRTRNDLLSYALPKAISHCANLKKLEILVLPQTWESIIHWDKPILDCGPLLECIKLEDVKIMTLVPFYFRNIEPVIQTLKLKRFSFLFLGEISSQNVVQEFATELITALMNAGHLQNPPAAPTQNQIDQLLEYFPQIFTQGFPPVNQHNVPDPANTTEFMLELIRQMASQPLYPEFKEKIINVLFFVGNENPQ